LTGCRNDNGDNECESCHHIPRHPQETRFSFARTPAFPSPPEGGLSLYHISPSFPGDKVSFAQAPAFPSPAWRGRVARQGRERASIPAERSDGFLDWRYQSRERPPSPAPAGAPSPPCGRRGDGKRPSEGKPCRLEMTWKCDREIDPLAGRNAPSKGSTKAIFRAPSSGPARMSKP
jgi:hypothetical protein